MALSSRRLSVLAIVVAFALGSVLDVRAEGPDEGFLEYAPSRAFAAPAAHSRAVSLRIKNELQQERNWCWAAVARQLIARRKGARAPFQCELAARLKGVRASSCCLGAVACRGTATLEELSLLLGREGVRSRRIFNPTPAALSAELSAGRALVVGLREPNRPRHLVVVRGIQWRNGAPELLINDPEGRRPARMSYADISRFWDAVLAVE
ncbi:MAG: papain-like cysteine protease family protein [Pseudomonadota bacterium]